MKIICVGRNYFDHINELKNEKPDSPLLFLKPETSIIQKKQPFFIPNFSNDVQYEVEVLIKINRLGKAISPKFSHKYYDEIGLGIDFTARDLQNKLKKDSLPWEKSKSFDGSALIGNWINKKNIDDLNNLDFSLTKNGDIVQKGNTSKMLWKIDKLISEISKFFTLKIGDIIFTGTPSGVGRVNENDNLVGYINEKECFSIKIK
ncbi:MAG: fumarylacetoacetate hydrolase family protein [Flavobacteriaceae bacterium]|jgi:2-keto-4-pentenoate hydratase/2-oxohepta-3-ene-1,7-dioic acid hydratase in catechol pathway|nr:fumarylacetoacetate hydrolase family protein [Pelagibacterales bacterium]MBT4959044.1 fumarylacetoacetate hydrolase family protein [Flavobacteriaceae bacterium]MBT6169711.1 fumarylacetoacetate hydrolase family protein [Flavobacteriaceae bacterium]MBT6447601.1 fumarylacetoacetate hydrolase family protein [Flavobacteriaceae bacterium]MDG1830263.1 fumarylacetoacetate hydrolase family protein [Flavobacteriaceae bacterium]|tara:strand:- start:62 stop:673 length:612 start_codon:yes stop_codon:yes gene_type:complete